ncbi:hypothetical protein PHET_10102 [Paragonimus heterotremus]|uniref:Uncharacterized protein n=1 Tax=Paragonimus heterotremus TaxID=100268 RepID=A0A8J4SUU9_9TREM|nr:hypothetical protein PHET_10102 [Paragonimus heterotremus]
MELAKPSMNATQLLHSAEQVNNSAHHVISVAEDKRLRSLEKRIVQLERDQLRRKQLDQLGIVNNYVDLQSVRHHSPLKPSELSVRLYNVSVKFLPGLRCIALIPQFPTLGSPLPKHYCDSLMFGYTRMF